MTETTAEHDENLYDPHADPQWSEDGHYWWDGGKWITAAEREAELEQAAEEESLRVEAARVKAERAREARARAAEEKAARVLAARAEAQAQREATAARREAERVAAAEAEAAEALAAQERAEESARLQAATAALAAERRAEAARAKAEAAAQKRAEAAAARAQAQAKAESAAARATAESQQRQAKSAAPQAEAPRRAQATTTTLPENRSAVRLWTRVVLALVLVLVVLAGFLVALLHKKSAPTTPAAPGGTVGSTLLAARDAEQKYHDKHARYTGSILDLTPLGFRPAKGVTLTVLRADAGTYCLSGAKGTDTYYLSSADLAVSRTPCS